MKNQNFSFLFFYLLILCSIFFPERSKAQNIKIVKYIPSIYFENNLHRVELINLSNRQEDISGCKVITWDYTFIFPKGTILQPNQIITMSRLGVKAPLTITYNRHPNFSLRSASRINGAYCCVFNRQNIFLDGFFVSPTDETSFLPDSVKTGYEDNKNKNLNIWIPPSNHPNWTSLYDDRNRRIKLANDPIVGYEKVAGRWKIISAKGSVLNPSSEFIDFQARYKDDHVILKWKTTFEDGLQFIDIQRSQDGTNFTTINQVKTTQQKSNNTIEYSFFDTNVDKAKVYYYRLKRIELDGQVAYTDIASLITTEPVVEFWIEPFPAVASDGEIISIRFFCAYQSNILIKLYRSNFEEIAILFDGIVSAEHQNLLKITKTLTKDDYWVCAIVNDKRYFKKISVR